MSLKDKKVSKKPNEGSPFKIFDYEFDVLRVVKGTFSEKKFEMQDIMSPLAREEATLSAKGNEATYGKDCKLLVSFVPDKQYIIFLELLNRKSFMEYKGDSDKWFKKVSESASGSELKKINREK